MIKKFKLCIITSLLLLSTELKKEAANKLSFLFSVAIYFFTFHFKLIFFGWRSIIDPIFNFKWISSIMSSVMFSPSLCEFVVSFRSQDLKAIAKETLFDALPMKGIIHFSAGLIVHGLNPKLLFDGDISDQDARNFIVKEDLQVRVKIAEVFCKRRIGDFETISETERTQCINSIADGLLQRLNRISQLANQAGIRKVLYSVSIPRHLKEGDKFTPWQAVGNLHSLMSPPVLVHVPALIASEFFHSNIEAKKKDFVVAHELSHIVENHATASLITSLATAALTMGVWIYGLSSGITLGSVVITYTASFVLNCITKIGSYALERKWELQADRKAMDLLDSNEGAVAFFEESSKKPDVISLCHPSEKKRLQHAQNWVSSKRG